MVHAFLTRSYWAKGIPVDVVRRCVDHSLCFSVFDSASQIGFARIISDCATFAYLADVFILDSYRGHGLSKWLMECIMHHPDLQGLRRWMLATRDAHGLYARFDFKPLAYPERMMEMVHENIYVV